MYTYVEYEVFFIELKPYLTHNLIIFHLALYNGHFNILKCSPQTEVLTAVVLLLNIYDTRNSLHK